MTLVPLSNALNHYCYIKSWEGSAFCFTNLVVDTHAYILMNSEGGNLVSALGVDGNLPLEAFDLG